MCWRLARQELRNVVCFPSKNNTSGDQLAISATILKSTKKCLGEKDSVSITVHAHTQVPSPSAYKLFGKNSSPSIVFTCK